MCVDCCSSNVEYDQKLFASPSCANAKKWEIELSTLKSNNIRLTSALQESTANVDEWKRQLHTYKEENLRMKRDMDAMKPSGSGGGGGAAATGEEDLLRRDNLLLRNRVQTLEKELLSGELELKGVQKQLKERPTEGNVSGVCECI